MPRPIMGVLEEHDVRVRYWPTNHPRACTALKAEPLCALSDHMVPRDQKVASPSEMSESLSWESSGGTAQCFDDTRTG